jgi:ubiquitin conjugation factor E4 B
MDDPSFVEAILLERLQVPGTRILFFTSEAYFSSRSESQKNLIQSNAKAQKLLSFLQEILVNYSALSVFQSEMFPSQAPEFPNLEGASQGAARVTDFLLNNGSKDFFMLLLNYWQREDPSFKDQVIFQMVVNLNSMVKQMTLMNDPTPAAAVFKDLLESNLLTGLVQKYLFNEAWNGNQVENLSILGGFLKPGLFPLAPYFGRLPNLPDPVRDKIAAEFKALRYQRDFDLTLKKYSDCKKVYTLVLTDILKILVKTERKLATEWLIDIVVKCGEKAKLGNKLSDNQVNINASDGFCLNLFDILLQLCQPIIEPGSNLVSKISDTFMAFNPKMSKVRETSLCNKIEKMSASPQEAGTVTEFYYCCCLMFHYSWNTAYDVIQDISRSSHRFQGSSNPAEKQYAEYLKDLQSCFLVNLQDNYRNSMILKLCNLTMKLILKWAGFNGKIPLPPPSPVLSIIPEFFLEDISEFYVAMLDLRTETLRSLSGSEISELLTAITVILMHPSHFTNPYTRAKLVKALSQMIVGKSGNELISGMNTNHLFQDYFIEGLIIFFNDIESGGSHSQFYDKFEYRHYASLIFDYLWKIPLYQQKTISLQGQPFFIKFINYLLNDMNYCLQEGIDSLLKIKKFRLRNPDELSNEEKEELSKISGSCKYMMGQSNEIIEMLKQISDWNSELFVTEEFGDRTAALLDNFLKYLRGPKCSELKIDNSEEFNFRPEQLLGSLIIIYLNISRHEKFFECLFKDERSFSIELFTRALNVFQKKPIISYEDKGRLREFIEKLRNFQGKQENIPDEDIPEEFLCEISCDLMKRPVRLPSGKAVDRVSIVRHLLSDEMDPFSRQPLKVEDLVEDLELKSRIDQWLASRGFHSNAN